MKRAIVAAASWLASLRHLSLLAVLAWTSHAHWHLAVQLGAPSWLAPLLPVAIDSYVLASFRAWEQQASAGPARVRTWDLLWAIGLDVIAVGGSHAAGQFDLTVARLIWWRAGLAGTLGILLVLTMWRVHALDVRVKPARSARANSPDLPMAKPVATPPAVAKPVAPVVKPQVTDRVATGKPSPTAAVRLAMAGGREMAMGEIVLAAGRPRATVKKAVGELVIDGEIVANGDPRKPRYRLATEPVRQAVSE